MIQSWNLIPPSSELICFCTWDGYEDAASITGHCGPNRFEFGLKFIFSYRCSSMSFTLSLSII